MVQLNNFQLEENAQPFFRDSNSKKEFLKQEAPDMLIHPHHDSDDDVLLDEKYRIF